MATAAGKLVRGAVLKPHSIVKIPVSTPFLAWLQNLNEM